MQLNDEQKAMCERVAKRLHVAPGRIRNRLLADPTLCEDELEETSLRMPDEKWITVQQAAQLLHVTPSAIQSTSSTLNQKYGVPSFGCRVRTRSTRGASHGRGCGWLYFRTDIENIRRIRRGFRVSLARAAYIAHVLRSDEWEGLLPWHKS